MGPVYDVPTINKEQQIIDTQLNTAYGQINNSIIITEIIFKRCRN